MDSAIRGIEELSVELGTDWRLEYDAKVNEWRVELCLRDGDVRTSPWSPSLSVLLNGLVRNLEESINEV